MPTIETAAEAVIAEALTAAEAESHQTPAQPEPPKRKRGRPRKNDAEGAGNFAENFGSTPKNRNSTASDLKTIEQQLQQMVGLIAMGVTFVDTFDGIIIADRGPAVISALMNIARTNAQLRAILLQMAVGGQYGALIAAIASLVLPIIARHGYMPMAFAGPLPEGAFDEYQRIQQQYFTQQRSNGVVAHG